MLAYRCRACRRLKYPDGAGCHYCGASRATLQIVEVHAQKLMEMVQGEKPWEPGIEVEDFRAGSPSA